MLVTDTRPVPTTSSFTGGRGRSASQSTRRRTRSGDDRRSNAAVPRRGSRKDRSGGRSFHVGAKTGHRPRRWVGCGRTDAQGDVCDGTVRGVTDMRNWAGNSASARGASRARVRRGAPGLVARAPTASAHSAPATRSTGIADTDGDCVARRPAAVRSTSIRPPDGHGRRRAALRRASPRLECGRVRAAQPGLAAAHLGGRARARPAPTARATATATWPRRSRPSRWSRPTASSSRSSRAADRRRSPGRSSRSARSASSRA